MLLSILTPSLPSWACVPNSRDSLFQLSRGCVSQSFARVSYWALSLEKESGGLTPSYKRVLTFPPFSVLLCTLTFIGFEFLNSEWFCRKTTTITTKLVYFLSFKSVTTCPLACKNFMTSLMWTASFPVLSLFLTVCILFSDLYFPFKGVLSRSRVKWMYSVHHA